MVAGFSAQQKSLRSDSAVALPRTIAVTEYNAFRVELADKIAHVQINRPDKINAMNQDFWREIIEIFRWVDDTDEVRVVVLSGA
ncbi:hypothetical protein KQ735_15450, partial [Listeria monocytogenes]|nr:hypothetical protein [Listeria monocytogenes]